MKCELFWFSYLPGDSLYSALVYGHVSFQTLCPFEGGAGKQYHDYQLNAIL